MNNDYNRGYSKGYAAGLRRSDAENSRLRETANQAAARAERVEKGQGLGHCENCNSWIRGDGSPNANICAWGKCISEPVAGSPYGSRMWSEGNEKKAAIMTTPLFGCVMFRAKR